MEVKAGYKVTDIGVIPDNWSIKRLSKISESQNHIRYGIVQPGRYEANGCLMLRSQDYSKGWRSIDGMHRITKSLENQYRNAKISAGDLIMTVVGAGVGQMAVAPDWLDGAVLSRSTARISISSDKANPIFVKAFLESPIGKRQLLGSEPIKVLVMASFH